MSTTGERSGQAGTWAIHRSLVNYSEGGLGDTLVNYSGRYLGGTGDIGQL